jgi:hypothetical protein
MRIGSLGVLCVFFALATAGCGGDDEDGGGGGGGGGGGARWKCYDDTMFGQCDCQNLPPGDDWINSGKGIVEVASCPAYQMCVTYYDAFFEVDGCSCGETGLMPLDAMNIMPVASCPP